MRNSRATYPVVELRFVVPWRLVEAAKKAIDPFILFTSGEPEQFPDAAQTEGGRLPAVPGGRLTEQELAMLLGD